MRYQQLKIDIKTEDGISDALYNAICDLIEEAEGEVLDDGNGPYTEDMSEYYEQIEG